ncbi:MAG: methyltransferase domain-containing protein [Actinomycetota bacterium]|nr:methyltransferase domain-containing protein [Actinomycetota bacterium]
MPWWYAVVESRHELQNPTSREKIRLLGRRLGLRPESRVLDLGSGRGGPALVLAEAFGCRITCVERADDFVSAARERIRVAGLSDLIELVHADARTFELEAGGYDAALCLGASFVWGGLAGTLDALRPAVRAGGFVAVGEPYWRRWPLPEEAQPDEGEDFATLPETVKRFEASGLPAVGVIASSEDDWDAYETLHWLALEEWLYEHPDDRDAGRFRERGAHYRERYLRWQRDLLGWAIFIGRKR